MYTLKWQKNSLSIIDQTKLPTKVEYIECSDYQRVITAIKRLEVRGAPAIGAAAAFALVLAAQSYQNKSFEDFREKLSVAREQIAQSRPTAVNLVWALDRLWQKMATTETDVAKIVASLEQDAMNIYDEDIAANKAMGKYGAEILPAKGAVLTHCNAGAMATCGWGTALGVIREAFNQGKVTRVYADETRPLLQGSRITAWELLQDKIPVTLITDSMAGWVMKNKLVSSVVTGADRIALNGDTANKIGTYSVAILAKEHNIPFYIAAPVSTIDFAIATGEEIPIEERDAKEVKEFCGVQSAPSDVDVFNPAFDVTPNHLIHGIITEYGVLKAPFNKAINDLKIKLTNKI